ncbi:hypothetical protein J2S09_000829 [Bacillus fengqiuensis]|nr:hypothetical protein [Bacillus fengqiuensis]
MANWGQIREKGKVRFILLSGTILSIPLILDYYIIKFLLSSFSMEFALLESFLVWVTCTLLGFLFGIYGWRRMESNWLDRNSFFE